MKLEMSLHQKQELQLKISPQIIQRIEILQLPSMDLKELIQKELMENEILEVKETEPGETEEKQTEEKPSPKEEVEADESGFEKLENIDDWNEYFPARVSRRWQDQGKDKKIEAMQNLASKPSSLQDYLYSQFNLLDASEPVKEVGKYIVYNVDDNGYLQYSLDEILEGIKEERRFSLEDAQEALAIIQRMDPKGVGGRNSQDCLILQLDPKDLHYHLKKRLLEEFLDDIKKNRIPKIAKETGESIETIKDMISYISTLDPTPGSAFSREVIHYIAPDVIIEWVDGNYEIRLEDNFFDWKITSFLLFESVPSTRCFTRRRKTTPRCGSISRKSLNPPVSSLKQSNRDRTRCTGFAGRLWTARRISSILASTISNHLKCRK